MKAYKCDECHEMFEGTPTTSRTKEDGDYVINVMVKKKMKLNASPDATGVFKGLYMAAVSWSDELGGESVDLCARCFNVIADGVSV